MDGCIDGWMDELVDGWVGREKFLQLEGVLAQMPSFPVNFCGRPTIVWTLKSECFGLNPSFAAASLLRIHFLL